MHFGVRALAPALLVSAIALGGCVEVDSRAPAPSATTRAAAPAPADRDIAILAVEDDGAALRVLSTNRRSRSSFSPDSTRVVHGATHRWRLVGTNEAELASGLVKSPAFVELPPNSALGISAAHAARSERAFVVRAPYPEVGERLELTDESDPGKSLVCTRLPGLATLDCGRGGRR
ncbi:MAG: hypothetical protein U0271_30015 [Polyangiaceae bacterium]